MSANIVSIDDNTVVIVTAGDQGPAGQDAGTYVSQDAGNQAEIRPDGIYVPISGGGGGGSDPTKVDKVPGKSLVSDTEIAKLLTVQADATKNATDAELRDRDTHTGEQAISTVTGLQGALSQLDADALAAYNLALTKVDKETGKSLIADSEISRLAGVSNYNDAPLALRVTNLESSVGDIDTALAAILGVTP